MLQIYALTSHIVGFLFGREALYGVAEHGTGHLFGVNVQEICQYFFVYPFTGFAEKPTHCFVHQIMGVVE